jgi:biotin carboxylase
MGDRTYDTRMPRVLLLMPADTYRAEDFMHAARRLGTEVVVASNRRQAMSARLGDGALVVALDRPHEAADRIVALAARRPLDAVVAVDDQGVLAAALSARKLGLRHNSPEAVAATRDKVLMRQRLASAGVPQPGFSVAGRDDDVLSLAAQVGFPCVIKPVGLSGSRGVIRADDPAAAALAAERVRGILADAGQDPDPRLLVERFLPGAEVAVEGLVRGGVLEVLAVFDKPDPLEGPYFEETLYVTPSRHPGAVLARVQERTAEAVRALGLEEGPVHAEVRISGTSVAILELAARSIGGLCGRSLRFGLGVSLEELILRHALGRPLEGMRREPGASGVMMLPIPAAGVLEGVGGQEEALAVAGVAGLEISIGPGRQVRPLPDGDRYLGFLFARGETPADVESALREAHARLDVRIAAAERIEPLDTALSPG